MYIVYTSHNNVSSKFIYHYETVIISHLKNHCERSLVFRLKRNQANRLKRR